MRVLVACEYSATVRDAFRSRGHDAWSCDLLPTEGNSEFHLQRCVLDVMRWTRGGKWRNEWSDWDLMIAFPPCTHLASSGARWFKDKKDLQDQALKFVSAMMSCACPRIAIENPVGVISTRIRKPDQIIQPWQFGHGEVKTTCLWLKGLPKLVPTNVVEGREQRCWKMPPSPDRARERSRTYFGIAEAMADQWGTIDGSRGN